MEDTNRTPTIVGTVVSLWILAVIAAGARLLARSLGRTRLWWDDWLIILAIILYTPGLCIGLIEAHLGAGKHIQRIIEHHPGRVTSFLKCIYTGELIYPPIICCIKCSIIALYNRIFGVKRIFALVCYILIGVIIMWALATTLGAIFQCDPISTAWNPYSTRANCFKLRPYLVGTNVVNVLLDVALLVAPMYPIWELKLPTPRKIMISAIFLLGACETAFSIVRLVEVTNLTTSDVTWNYVNTIVWSSVEISMGIVCACLPVMAPLFPSFFRKGFSSTRSRQPSNFQLSSTSNNFTHTTRQHFNHPDDSAEAILETGNPKAIKQTIDISVHHGNRASIDLEARGFEAFEQSSGQRA